LQAAKSCREIGRINQSKENKKMEIKAYCMKCKAEQVVQDAQIVTMKNGRTAAQGVCPVCGTKMFKFLPKQKNAPTESPAAPTEPTPTA